MDIDVDNDSDTAVSVNWGSFKRFAELLQRGLEVGIRQV